MYFCSCTGVSVLAHVTYRHYQKHKPPMLGLEQTLKAYKTQQLPQLRQLKLPSSVLSFKMCYTLAGLKIL